MHRRRRWSQRADNAPLFVNMLEKVKKVQSDGGDFSERLGTNRAQIFGLVRTLTTTTSVAGSQGGLLTLASEGTAGSRIETLFRRAVSTTSQAAFGPRQCDSRLAQTQCGNGFLKNRVAMWQHCFV